MPFIAVGSSATFADLSGVVGVETVSNGAAWSATSASTDARGDSTPR